MLIIIMLILTVCFVAALALICAAPEGHELEGVGFHTGPLEGCPACRAFDAPPCRSCGFGPCVCGEFDCPTGAQRKDRPNVGLPPVALSSSFHPSEVAHD